MTCSQPSASSGQQHASNDEPSAAFPLQGEQRLAGALGTSFWPNRGHGKTKAQRPTCRMLGPIVAGAR
eukprot:929798-Pyramimonas_sp.AAC.1